MSKPRGKRSVRTSEPSRQAASGVSLGTAQRMLPLVSHIVEEIQDRWQHLSELEKEQTTLDRRRRKLEWPERARRYQVAEDIAREQRGLQEAVLELEHLRVLLVDPLVGEVAFPTVIGGRRAYFVWRKGSPEISWWCYAGDQARNAIPESWRR